MMALPHARASQHDESAPSPSQQQPPPPHSSFPQRVIDHLEGLLPGSVTRGEEAIASFLGRKSWNKLLNDWGTLSREDSTHAGTSSTTLAATAIHGDEYAPGCVVLRDGGKAGGGGHHQVTGVAVKPNLPLAVLHCSSSQDVLQCVRVCKADGVKMSARGEYLTWVQTVQHRCTACA
jgi:hypothetical protein